MTIPPVLAPALLVPALLAVAAAAAWALDTRGSGAGRPLAAGAAWLAPVVLSAAWFGSGRVPLELTTSLTVGGAPLLLRLDGIVVLFEVVVLVPVALLLTFQARSSGEAAMAALVAAVAVLTLEAGSVLLTALGLGTCAGLVLVVLRDEGPEGTEHGAIVLSVAALLLLWAAVLLEVAGGTSAYGAVPVTALQVPVFASLAGAGLLVAGLVPWRPWFSGVIARRRPQGAALAVAVLVPLGFDPLFRAYSLSGGQLPGLRSGLLLSGLGLLTLVGAAVRAQAASSRLGFLGEMIPFTGGLTLLALGLGTSLGMVAALIALLAVGVLAGLVPLLADDAGSLAALGAAAAVGMPPGLVFGAGLLVVQAALESGPGPAYLGLAALAGWLLVLAGAGRALGLPQGTRPGSELGSAIGLAMVLGAGIGLGALVALLAIPAAAELLPRSPIGTAPASVSQAAILSGSSLSVNTASGGWPAAMLSVPMLLLTAAAVALLELASRRGWVELAWRSAERVAPPPLFPIPLAGASEHVRWAANRLRLPEQYRSLFRPALLEAAVGRSRPWLWITATLVLAIAVTR